MQREVVIGGKLRRFEEIEGIVALKAGEEREPSPEPIPTSDPRLKEGLAPFVLSGWVFRPRDNACPWGKGKRSSVATPAIVLRDDHGHIYLWTDRILVKLNPELTEPQAKAWLEAASLHPIRRLRFAPNFFEARIDRACDLFEKLRELASLSEVRSAEPELLEAVELR